MKNNRNMKRKGFTLVELLIVIVVIGVLSAMMMLSSTEAVTSARASNIISNLRNLKTAATAMYVDKQDYAKLKAGQYTSVTNPVASIDVAVKYMNSGSDSASTNDANLKNYGMLTSGKKWYVFITGVADNVGKKLAGRAQSVGLVGLSAATDDADVTTPYASGGIVGMEVLNTEGL